MVSGRQAGASTASTAAAVTAATAIAGAATVRGGGRRRGHNCQGRQAAGRRVLELLLRQRAQAEGDRRRQAGRKRQAYPLDQQPRREYHLPKYTTIYTTHNRVL